MSKTSLSLLLTFLVLVPAQALFFNHLVLFNVAVPLVFVYMVVSLPVTFSANVAMTVGFLTGLSVDILSDTPGVNAIACTLLAFVRRPVFHLYVPTDNDLAEQRPLPRTMGAAAYLKYALTMCVLYCLMVFAVESMRVFSLKLFVLRAIASSIFTFVIVYAIASLGSRREKRL